MLSFFTPDVVFQVLQLPLSCLSEVTFRLFEVEPLVHQLDSQSLNLGDSIILSLGGFWLFSSLEGHLA